MQFTHILWPCLARSKMYHFHFITDCYWSHLNWEIQGTWSLLWLDGQTFHLYKCPRVFQTLFLTWFIILQYKQYGFGPKSQKTMLWFSHWLLVYNSHCVLSTTDNANHMRFAWSYSPSSRAPWTASKTHDRAFSNSKTPLKPKSFLYYSGYEPDISLGCGMACLQRTINFCASFFIGEIQNSQFVFYFEENNLGLSGTWDLKS